MLKFEGFNPTRSFTADVHANHAQNYCKVEEITKLLRSRENDLGQYIFLKATLIKQEANLKKPSWLYRSYTEEELA